MFRIASRVKTDGKYIASANMDAACSVYGNRVDEHAFDTVKLAVRYICAHGEHNRVYFVCEEADAAAAKICVEHPTMDAGSGWIARQKWAFTDGEWTRMNFNNRKKWEQRRGYYW